jgi:hypothetical protein
MQIPALRYGMTRRGKSLGWRIEWNGRGGEMQIPALRYGMTKRGKAVGKRQTSGRKQWAGALEQLKRADLDVFRSEIAKAPDCSGAFAVVLSRQTRSCLDG